LIEQERLDYPALWYLCLTSAVFQWQTPRPSEEGE